MSETTVKKYIITLFPRRNIIRFETSPGIRELEIRTNVKALDNELRFLCGRHRRETFVGGHRITYELPANSEYMIAMMVSAMVYPETDASVVSWLFDLVAQQTDYFAARYWCGEIVRAWRELGSRGVRKIGRALRDVLMAFLVEKR